MKRYTLFVITAFVLLTAVFLNAQNWNEPDKEYFSYQKDIDKTVSNAYTKSMATINFSGQLYNFANYVTPFDGRIIIRKLTNDGTVKKDGTVTLKWSYEKDENIKNLNSSAFDWQPAPVVFKDQLLLFYGTSTYDSYNQITIHGISYSVYNSGTKEWSEPIKIDEQRVLYGLVQGSRYAWGMSASVVDNKLCLVYLGSSGLELKWTEDLVNWNLNAIGSNGVTTNPIPLPYVNSQKDKLQQISTISSSFIDDNGTKKPKLMIGFIDDKYDAKVYEYYFDENNSLIVLSGKTISNDENYSSIALAEGSVDEDPSSGNCVQAFLKLNVKDNSHFNYRIQRYQSIDGNNWKKRENNLVPQTSPQRMWASKNVNLTAAIYPVQDGNDIRQFMCLIYRGYDDWDYPLNCAYVETDRYYYKIPKAGEISSSQELAGPENTQYIGYIEGVPPYYLNNGTIEDPYMNKWYNPISKLEFSTSSTESSTSEIGFDIGGEVKFNYHMFKAELSYTFGKKWETELSKSQTFKMDIPSEGETLGYYVTFRPIVTRAQYYLKDVHKNELGLISYYYMSDPKITLEPVELKHGLNSADPKTFLRRSDVNLSTYNTSRYGKTSNYWTGGVETSAGIEIEESKSMTNTHKVKLKLSAELGKIFDIGFEGSFEYSLKITTSTKNELAVTTQFNQPVDPNDVTALGYDVYWIKPLFKTGVNNWWLHEGAETQNTWCITYDVTYIKRKNGTEEHGNSYNENEINSDNITIVSFTADETASGVTLKWQTLNEENNNSFSIERKSAKEEWRKIGFIEEQENYSSTKAYSFTDTKPVQGVANYRLNQIDVNNKLIYSNVVEIEVNQQLPTVFSLMQNYPNPFNPATKISFTVSSNAHASLKVFNLLGQEVAVLFNGEAQSGKINNVEFNGTSLASGIYFSRLESEGQVSIIKMQLIK